MPTRSCAPRVLSLAVLTVGLASCDDVRHWDICNQEVTECKPGFVCDLRATRCVPVGDGGTIADAPPAGGGAEVDGRGTGGGEDGGEMDGGARDGGDAGLDADASVDVAGVPDAAGTCGTVGDCTDPGKPFCVGGVCVDCVVAAGAGAAADGGTAVCVGATPVCDARTRRCVGCVEDGQCGSAAAPICDKIRNVCAGCGADAECRAKSPALPACRGDGQCVECTAGNSGKCGGATPVCNDKLNLCVECTSSARCGGKTPICGASDKCQACAADAECAALGDPARFACAAGGACVECTATNALKCAGATPVCDTKLNLCVECASSANCSGATPICGSNDKCRACGSEADCAGLNDPRRFACGGSGACVECTAANAGACTGTTPVCDAARSVCVQCTSSSHCGGSTPICGGNNRCQGCAADGDCAGLGDAARGACAGSGACVQCTSANASACTGATPVCNTASNRCVECVGDAQCTSDASKSFCVQNACRGCQSAASGACGARDSSKPVCLGTGICVQCTAAERAACTGTTPVCEASTNTCRACAADSECAGIGPGVCMKHQDGRCASSAETIIVSAGGTLPSSVPAGKRLLVVRGSVTGTITWSLSGPQMTIVGQSSGTIVGPGSSATTQTGTVRVTGGSIYIRNLSITAGSPGLWADGGAVVRLDRVDVSNNTAGGILLDGVGFEIANATVNGNGANSYGTAAFGGISIQNATSPKSLAYSTVTGNGLIGVACSVGTSLSPVPTSVLASSNIGGNVGAPCGFTSCPSPGTSCGAQP